MKVIVLIAILTVVAIEANGPDWQSYVGQLLGSHQYKEAAIIGLDGETKAEGGGLQLLPGEGITLVELFNKSDDDLRTGFMVEGVKYDAITSNGITIWAINFPGESQFLVLYKTMQTVLIGVSGDQFKLYEAQKAVGVVGSELIDLGY